MLFLQCFYVCFEEGVFIDGTFMVSYDAKKCIEVWWICKIGVGNPAGTGVVFWAFSIDYWIVV